MPKTDPAPLNILLVDDNEDNRLLIRAFLKKTTHRADVAEDGEKAVEKFMTGKYDLVFMDIEMPVMDGYTATKKIRSWEQNVGAVQTPIIALTAYAGKQEERKCLNAGCNGHLAKPVTKTKLLEYIAEYSK